MLELTDPSAAEVHSQVTVALSVLGIVLFAYSTMITWGYYGERGVEYLFGEKAIIPYRWLYILVIPLGAYARLLTVWSAADIANGLMAFPNLIGILGLSGTAAVLTKEYFNRRQKSK